MSRCVLDNEQTGIEVVIGWDPPLGTYFAQVIRPGSDEPIIWLGTSHNKFTAPDVLIEAISPYACKFDRNVLISNLALDRSNNSERIYSA